MMEPTFFLSHFVVCPDSNSQVRSKSKEKNQTVIAATISVLEPMGHEMIVTCDSSAGEIVGKYTDKEVLEVGQEIYFELNRENTHFFDQKGLRLE